MLRVATFQNVGIIGTLFASMYGCVDHVIIRLEVMHSIAETTTLLLQVIGFSGTDFTR